MHPSGFHCFILALNSDRDFAFLMSSGTSYHVLGPLKLIVSVPWETVCTFEVLNSGSFRKLYGLCES